MKVIEYKTGYDEFMVTKIAMANNAQEYTHCTKSLSIAIVLQGEAEVEVEGHGTVKLEDKSPYYIMPNQKWSIKKKKDSDL